MLLPKPEIREPTPVWTTLRWQVYFCTALAGHGRLDEACGRYAPLSSLGNPALREIAS